MDEIGFSWILLLNIVFLGCGYAYLMKSCEDMRKDVRNYRQMTLLEISLLNKKIESKNETNVCS